MRLGCLLLAMLFLCVPAWGVPPARMKHIFTTPDRRVEVCSDGAMSVGDARAVAERIQAAYRWLMEIQQWPRRGPLDRPLQVRVVVSPTSHVLGTAVNGEYFRVGLHYLATQPQLSEGTLAHELTHIQDARQLKPARIPGFIAEGRGLSDGFFYRKSLGFPPQPYDRGLARSITRYTPADVETVVSRLEPGDLRDPKENAKLEFIGCWFVEYLRAGYNGGFPDVQPRLARMITSIHQGTRFLPAFHRAFGVEFRTVKEAFLQHARQHKGAARLKGTIWEGLVAEGDGG